MVGVVESFSAFFCFCRAFLYKSSYSSRNSDTQSVAFAPQKAPRDTLNRSDLKISIDAQLDSVKKWIHQVLSSTVCKCLSPLQDVLEVLAAHSLYGQLTPTTESVLQIACRASQTLSINCWKMLRGLTFGTRLHNEEMSCQGQIEPSC